MLLTTSNKPFLFLLLLLVLAAGFPAYSVGSLSDQEREQKQAELKVLRKNISSLQEEINSTRTRHSNASRELQKIEMAIGKTVSNLKQINQKYRQQQKRLKKLFKEKRHHEKELSVQRSLLAEQLRTAYKNGRQEYLKLILNQQDPAAVSRVMTYYNYFNKARTQRIDKALQTISRLEKIKTDIEQQQQVLTKLKQQQLAEKQQLEKSYNKRAVVVVQLRKELNSKDKKLSRLLENEKQIQRLLQAIREVMPELLRVPDESLPFARLRGKLEWPASGSIKKVYGKRRQPGNLRWNGIVIRAPQGRTVHAVARGRVAYADWLRGYGLLLIIDHGDGYMSLYGHNQSLFRETGDWVEAGEEIASIGNSGGQQQSGLYFEIRHKGKPTNPGKWCRKQRRG
ncbi:MAG: peptidoglycan DD-metalloendopeptidase family protein [Gammaproteobacteria bacterium]